jgi:hypothetical protein
MPKVQFLFIEDALKNSNSVNAETLVKIVHDKMDSFGLERRKLGSLFTDGASVLIAKNGVEVFLDYISNSYYHFSDRSHSSVVEMFHFLYS